MDESFIHQNRIRQLFFLFCIVLLGVLLALELAGFLPALLGAVTLYVLMRWFMNYLVITKSWPKPLAASVILLLCLVVVLIPIAGLVGMLSSKVAFAIEHSNEMINSLKSLIAQLEKTFNISLISPDTITELGNMIAQTLPKLISATFSTLGTLFFVFFLLYFMLVNGPEMEAALYEYMPLKDESVDQIGREMHTMVVSNAVGIPVIAILQGVVALVAYFIVGVKEPWFWFGFTCITAMLPIVGAALAYVPLAIILLAGQQTWQGIFILIYGFGVIGTVDNIFRFTLAKKIANVHPLITVFGVIIGLKLFGFIGLIFGPILISLFILLLKIYTQEFFVKQRELHRHGSRHI